MIPPARNSLTAHSYCCGFAIWQHRTIKKADALRGELWRTTPETHPGFAEAKPAPEPKPDPYAKYVEAALRAAEADRQGREVDAAYWKERDRGKGWDRDR